jgi:glycosyltransferase involved in cell wall biosynthesis
MSTPQPSRRRVLLVSPEVVGARMAGPALRFWHMASVLARHHDVTLAVERGTDIRSDAFDVVTFDRSSLRRMAAAADVVIIQGYVLYYFPEAHPPSGALVVDLYDPFHIEAFNVFSEEAAERRRLLALSSVDVVRHQVGVGDFFLCASERQRVFWLGHLAVLGRLTPLLHDHDPTFRNLIDLAPFGVGDEPPAPGPALFKGTVMPAEGQLLLWAGGIYDWLDPLLVVRAFAAIHGDHPDAHLVFLGMGHPNPATPPQKAMTSVRNLVRDLGVPRVHFHGWIPWAERGSLLVEADIGVSAHPRSLETLLSYRTRLLDHLWAGLPTVATGGDELASAIEQTGAGLVVEPGDVDGFAKALASYLEDRPARSAAAAAARRLGADMSWERQLRPLLAFCAEPRLTALRDMPADASPPHDFQWTHLARRAWDYVAAGEYRMAWNRLDAHARRFVHDRRQR